MEEFAVDWHIIAIVLAFILMDIITGIAQAAKNKELDSSKMRDGLFHKIGFMFAVVLSCLCEYAMMWLDLGFDIPMIGGVCTFICLTELVSILENIALLAPELSEGTFLSYFNRGAK